MRDKNGRLRVRRWCGEHKENARPRRWQTTCVACTCGAQRRVSGGPKPNRGSQLARLLQILTDQAGRDAINIELKKLDNELKSHKPIVSTQETIAGRHNMMLGDHLTQALEIGLSASDFQRLASRLSISVDQFEIEQNGLGFKI